MEAVLRNQLKRTDSDVLRAGFCSLVSLGGRSPINSFHTPTLLEDHWPWRKGTAWRGVTPGGTPVIRMFRTYCSTFAGRKYVYRSSRHSPMSLQTCSSLSCSTRLSVCPGGGSRIGEWRDRDKSQLLLSHIPLRCDIQGIRAHAAPNGLESQSAPLEP
jgi:hypothetical protein